MNPFPFVGLALIATGYSIATDRLTDRFTAPLPEITAYDAGDPAVYDVLGHGAEPYDQPHCATHGELAETLDHDFAEAPVERRVEGDGLEMELWASEVMGTWTILHRGEDGISCIVSSGIGWGGGASAELVFAQAAVAH